MGGKHERLPGDNIDIGPFLGAQPSTKIEALGLSDVERYYRDTVEIIKPRCFVRMEKMRRVMEEYGMPLPPKDVHFESVLKREMVGYQVELARHYKKKFPKSSYLRDIFNASTKNGSFFRIVSFDRAWLFIDWARERILKAQEDGDRSFLKGLGEHIALEPKIKPLSPNYQRVLDFSEAYIDSRNELHKGVISELHKLLRKEHEEWFPEKLRVDEQIFYRLLLRNSIISPIAPRKKIAPSPCQKK
jgi:hypothetical protein